jgi:hypothetical protein
MDNMDNVQSEQRRKTNASALQGQRALWTALSGRGGKNGKTCAEHVGHPTHRRKAIQIAQNGKDATRMPRHIDQPLGSKQRE